MALKIGIIGFGGHAKKLLSVIGSFENCALHAAYHPGKRPQVNGGTTSFEDLLPCDAIFITSPNNTHSNYLLRLQKQFDGYVFCEKPPVNRLEDLDLISKLDFRKTFFGFNLRFSELITLVSAAISNGNLGTPIFASVILTYAFAYKKQYLDSWKSKREHAGLGVVENVSIHYVDLLTSILGPITRFNTVALQHARNGNVPDTAHIQTVHSSGAIGSIATSYSAAFTHTIELIGSNGILNYDEECLRIFSPRETFDVNGNYIKPRLISEQKVSSEDLFQNSIRAQLEYFLNRCATGTPLEEHFFRQSISSTRAILSNS